ncbi:hypothetical protein H6F77_03340 [Microcoleus sp. FACHB-831]|uniref:hypothetical protein n=1 Tax=Microcoleus sp. FACHB-831 TaxID=2692827 RepID=UPI001682516A|nr:hypothetical protein [Microcoleus sp. FACHB-831]MBD1920149.1 hypothetical protein [Microcoleus sp. FACHB-831]
MTDNQQQPVDNHDENSGSTTASPSVRPPSTRMRVAYAALAGAAFGAVASAVASALTGKGVADGVKAVVAGAGDTVKSVADGVKATIIDGAVGAVQGAVQGVASSVQPTIDSLVNAVQGVAEGIQPPVEGTADAVQGVPSYVQPPVEGTADAVQGVPSYVQPPVEGTVEAARVSAPLEQQQVVERTPPVDAVKPVASAKVEFQEPQVARMQVEQEITEIAKPVASAKVEFQEPQVARMQVEQETAKTQNASDAPHSIANDPTINVALDATSNAALVELLLSKAAKELAMSYYEQLPGLVVAEIHRLATNPTPEEKERIRDSWAKALQPLAMAIIQSGELFNASTAIAAAKNGYLKQQNQVENQ